MFESANKLDSARKEEFKEAATFLNMFLSNDKYVAGDHLTIADVALVASAANMQVITRTLSNTISAQRSFSEGRRERDI